MANNNTDNQISKVAVTQLDNITISDSCKVRCTIQGEQFVDIIKYDYKPYVGTVKLNRSEYLVKSTGEIKQYKQQHINDCKSRGNLKRTFNELKYLIRTNFTENSQNQLFVTLTYADNMQDSKRLYGDFKNFIKRLKYKYPIHKFEYIVVAEPQERGAWHMHVMLKSNQPVLYIDNKDMVILWGHGYTDTERLKSDDVGNYYVAYFTDLLDDGNIDNNASKSKMRKKGERLELYPKGFKFYRCSRGIERPSVINCKYGDIVTKYGQPKYTNAYEIELVTEDVTTGDIVKRKTLNRVTRQSFCKKQKKLQKKFI